MKKYLMKKSSLLFNKKNLICIFTMLVLIITTELKTEEQIESKIKNISLQLRCMTCQNQSIYDSEADFSIEMKRIIKKLINEGKTEKEIIKFMVDRYGEYISFRPMMNKKNIFLWLFPFVLFAISLIFLTVHLKNNKNV